MGLYSIFGLLRWSIWPIIIIGLIIFFVARRRRKKGVSITKEKDWYLQFVLSKEDAVSQLFLLLSFFFLGVTLLSFNRDFGDPLSWRTILFLTSLLGFISAYYFKTIYTLLFSLVGLTSWWGAQATQWIDGKDIKTSALFAGLSFLALLFYTLGHLHEKEMKFKRFALVYLVLGIIAVTGALFFLSTKPGLSVLAGMTKGATLFGSWQLTVSLILFGIALLGALFYAASQKLMSVFEILAVAVLSLLFGIVALLPQQELFMQSRGYYGGIFSGNELSSIGVLWAIIFNFAVFVELLGLIFSGYLRKESWIINLGAFFLFLLILVKYFDWFFTFLDKSIFFIGAGILLFVVGWFMERGRRYMISSIKSKTQQIS